MKPRRLLSTICLVFACLAISSYADRSPRRIVALDGVTTEIIFALGAGDELVGRPDTAEYPEEAKAIPSIGSEYYFNVESVLAMKPSLIICVDHPYTRRAESEQMLMRSGVEMLRVPYVTSMDKAEERIRLMAAAVDKPEKGETLIKTMRAGINEVTAKVKERSEQNKPALRLACLLLTERGAYTLGGVGAPVALAEICGVKSAFGDATPTPLNAEAFTAARPDVIMVYANELRRFGGIDRLLELPGVGLSPAGKNKRIVAIDYSLLSGWGPRVGEAARQLWHGFYEADGSYVNDQH